MDYTILFYRVLLSLDLVQQNFSFWQHPNVKVTTHVSIWIPRSDRKAIMMALMWKKSLQFVCFDEFVKNTKARCLSRIVSDPFRKGFEQYVEFCIHYVLTRSIREHLKNLARAVFIRRYPVLLQGLTSSDFSLCRIDAGAVMCHISTINLA